ncbi:HEPN domain-containing protein [Agrobacterium sp. 22-3674b3]
MIEVPESGEGFEELMRGIDAECIQEGIAIPGRSLHAIMKVGTRYKISIPITNLIPGARPDLARYAPLSQNIRDWYKSRYGDRLKTSFSPGNIATSIEGDLYEMRLPLVMGQAQFILSRRFVERPEVASKGPAICNILQLITDLTEGRAATLNDDTLRELGDDFQRGFIAHDILQTNSDHELIEIARGDIETAVRNMLDRGQRYGESKWASLQAAEKVLKAAITLAGGQFKFSHSLAELCKQLEGLGILFQWKPLVDEIQCKPGIRYREEACNRGQALAAHKASLELVLQLTNAGAKFEKGLG